MSKKTIYDTLVDAGLTPEGACGLMGNMAKESTMHSNNLQDSYNSMFKLSDEQYTALADAGKPTYNGKYFMNDEAGYGLCQWTHPSRKRDLLQFSKNWGVSVGAEDMQVEFCLFELRESYPQLLSFLSETQDIYTAAERVCKEYERPAVNDVETRYRYAQEFYDAYAAPAGEDENDVPQDPIIMILQMVLSYNGYSVEITGHKDNATLDALQDFISVLMG